VALPVKTQLKYWGIAAVLFAVVLWSLGNVLLPFILGGAIAYCLDPVADWLERVGLSRAAATALITVVAVLLFVVMVLAIIPTLVNQTISLFDTAPQLFRDLQAFLAERFPSVLTEGSVVRETITSLGTSIRDKGGELMNTALASVASLLNIVTLFVIVPVVAVYLLLDWDRMVAKIDAMVPLDHRATVRHLAREIDRVLAGFIRGMGSVCLILGIYYAAALWAVGLQFGLVVGVVAGMLTFIPYVGAIVGGLLAIGLALFQFWGDWVWIIVVWAIFQSGQFIEGNVLTPRMVGNSVGLHPVWLLFALSVFGSLFGFVGLLVAVPVAAALGVIARFLVDRYKGSRLFLGLSREHDRP
jgi:predicted PurR-regulated permease PerM